MAEWRLRLDFTIASPALDPTRPGGDPFPVPDAAGPARVTPAIAAARTRLRAALPPMGAVVGAVVVQACCFREPMESIEWRMGWAPASGWRVVAAGLEKLKFHYRDMSRQRAGIGAAPPTRRAG